MAVQGHLLWIHFYPLGTNLIPSMFFYHHRLRGIKLLMPFATDDNIGNPGLR